MESRLWRIRNAVLFRLKRSLRGVPLIGSLARTLYRAVFPAPPEFRDSTDYWVRRYQSGGNSGEGSYNHLALFKAEILNSFVQEFRVTSVAEFGCGDGSQLKLARYRKYIGYDVSPVAINRCNALFAGDPDKRFKLLEEYRGEPAELALSLDVIYHLVEDEVYARYMEQLFDAAERFVVVYSSNMQSTGAEEAHVRHRHFSEWVDRHRADWTLMRHVPNRFPLNGGPLEGSFADFFIYQRKSGA